jgi:NAD(P)-dependent dehydrogenase (short-subunit alcohol dehydrogenase family)
MDLAGAGVVVTGGGSGIGRAAALAFASGGASVAVADIAEDAGSETVSLVEAAGGRAAFFATDVADPRQIERLLDGAEAEFGRVDVVCNNAGIVCGAPLWPDTDPDRLMRQIAVDLGGVVIGTRLAIERLARRGGGAVVNTASMAAIVPMVEEPAYSATKSAVLMFTRACAAVATTHGVRVTAVMPGLVETPLLAKSGDGTKPAVWVDKARGFLPVEQADDVAAVIVDLAREGAGGEWRLVSALPDRDRALIRMKVP